MKHCICRAEQHGLRLTSNVSSSTKILLQGTAKGVSSKRKKAEELQVPVADSVDDIAEMLA